MPRRSQPISAARRGYSLPEMLIVLAILAAMAALVLPSLQGPLDKSRLRAAARDVQSSMNKARSLAIREGAAVEFRYEVGGSRWKVERPSSANTAILRLTRRSEEMIDSKPPVGTMPLAFGDAAIDEPPAPTILRDGRLPDGVTFAEPGFAEPTVAGLSVEEPASADVSVRDTSRAPDAGIATTIQWSDPVTFRPNGRGEDSTLTVVGNRDFVIDVSVRGLTSAVSYSTPFRRTPDANDLAIAEVPR